MSRQDIITPEQAVTLHGLFRARVERAPSAVAYRSHDRHSGRWQEWSWAAMAQEVARWQAGLTAEGLRPGDRVALLLRNCPQWVAFEQAALGLGLVVVPLYQEERPENTAYILADAGVKLLLVQDVNRCYHLAPHLVELERLERILTLHPNGHGRGPGDLRAVAVDEWLPAGEFELQSRPGSPEQLATLVYTSGTTDRPKGVMLSHGNILSNAYAAVQVEAFYTDDLFLSFLPLSHMFERTGGYYLPMMAGATVAYARSVQTLGEDLQQVRPTFLMSVPRVFERIYARIHGQLDKRSVATRQVFRLAVHVGWRRFQGSRGPEQLLWPLLQRKVAAPILERLGGRLRYAISGGAALPPPVARLFIGLGVKLLQGYGLTEAGPVVSVNRPDDNRPDGVGLPLSGVEVRIGEQEELLVKGPGVMLGYWNDHNATAEAIDADGWLHTGDQAHLDDGHIHITGRIKDILVLSNGEKIPPVEMEAAISLDPLFDSALILGEGQAYLAALVVLNEERWPTLARDHDLDPEAPESLEDAAIRRLVLKRIAEQLHDFPGYAKVRRVALLREAWTVEAGLLTPTLKLRRTQVLERYSREIEELFTAGHA